MTSIACIYFKRTRTVPHIALPYLIDTSDNTASPHRSVSCRSLLCFLPRLSHRIQVVFNGSSSFLVCLFSLSFPWHPFHRLTSELVVFHSMHVTQPRDPATLPDLFSRFPLFAYSSSLPSFLPLLCDPLFPSFYILHIIKTICRQVTSRNWHRPISRDANSIYRDKLNFTECSPAPGGNKVVADCGSSY